MSFALGTAVGRIVLDYDGKGIDEANKDVEGLQDKSKKTEAALSKVGNTALVSGAAVAGGLVLATNSAADFEQRMSGIQAVSGATSKEMDALSAKALQLGKDTKYSAGESAQAIEELIKAGLSVDDVLNGAADAAVNLAAAGEIDIPQAATIAANAMNQFGLAAQDMPAVADAIAGAANASAIDVNDFGESLKQVGAVANLAGVDFKDTATAIALMGNAGIRGSDAGTSLKSMFARLQPVTKKQKDLFKELGLVTKDGANQFYDAEGRLKDLSSVSGILQKSLKGMTQQQKQATLQTLFGSDAIRAAAILSNQGSKGFDKMAKSMDKVKAADVAKTRMDNLKGSIEQMKGSLETAGIAIGTAILPPLRTLVDAVTDALNWFLGLSDGMQKAITISAAVVAAVLLIVGAVIKFVLFAKQLQEALIVLRAAMASTWLAALGPIALIIAAVAAVVAIIILLWKKSETFRKIVLAVWGAIKAAVAAVASWFTGTLVPWIVNAWNAIKDATVAVWNAIIAVIQAVINAIVSFIQAQINMLLGIWNAVWGLFGPAVRAIFAFIVSIIKLAWTIIKGLFILYLRAIKTVYVSAWNVLKNVTKAVWNAIKAIITGVWRVIGPVVKGAVNTIKAVISKAWDLIKSATSKVWNGLIKPIAEFIGKAIEKLQNLKSRITGFFSNAGEWLKDAGKKIIQGLLDGIESMFGALKDKVDKVTGFIGKFLPGSPVKEGALRVLNNGYAGKQIVKMVIDGISSQQGALASATNDVAAVVPGGIAPLTGKGGRIRRRGAGNGPAGDLTIRGTLELTKDGKAVLTGVAVGVVDADDDYEDTLGRMG